MSEVMMSLIYSTVYSKRHCYYYHGTTQGRRRGSLWMSWAFKTWRWWFLSVAIENSHQKALLNTITEW